MLLLRRTALCTLCLDGTVALCQELLRRGEQLPFIPPFHYAQTFRDPRTINIGITLRRLPHTFRKRFPYARKKIFTRFHDIRNPITHIPKVCGSPYDHLHGHAAPPDILQSCCECKQLTRTQIRFDRTLNLIDNCRKMRKHLR